MKINFMDILRATLGAALVAIFLMLFCGCQSVAPAVVPAYSDSVITRVQTQYDSIWVDRWHVVKEKGDTVFVHDSIFIEKWRERSLTDTVYISKETPYPVEVVKEVRKRNWYDHATAAGFWAMLAIFTGVILWKLAKWRFRAF